MSVAVVTDSSANLSEETAREWGITIVPLQVAIGEETLVEGAEGATPAKVAEALADGVRVSTSRPSPQSFVEVFDALAHQGAEAIVSVHLSAETSGTVEAAELAASEVDVPVLVVDSRQVGVATGFAAVSAAEQARAGGTPELVARAARDRAAAATSLFYVDTLEHLRRGGRIGAAAALVGGALAVKPLLEIIDGAVRTKEKVRTAARALARLEELAVDAARGTEVDVCVLHLVGADRATQLRDALEDRLAEELGGREIWCGEVGAALSAHVGPGMVAVCVAPRRPLLSTGG